MIPNQASAKQQSATESKLFTLLPWQWTASPISMEVFHGEKSLEFDCRRGSLHSTHRIHGAAIYGNMDPINIPHYTPVMLAYIPAPWIRHGHRYWLKKEKQELLVLMMYQSYSVKNPGLQPLTQFGAQDPNILPHLEGHSSFAVLACPS